MDTGESKKANTISNNCYRIIKELSVLENELDRAFNRHPTQCEVTPDGPQLSDVLEEILEAQDNTLATIEHLNKYAHSIVNKLV